MKLCNSCIGIIQDIMKNHSCDIYLPFRMSFEEILGAIFDISKNRKDTLNQIGEILFNSKCYDLSDIRNIKNENIKLKEKISNLTNIDETNEGGL